MFRKAQLKFFGIITGILLAVFIAVLGSVNLIMRAVMERQSRTVLRQIAEGVEYDDITSTFTFIHPDHGGFKPENDIPPKPAKTTSAVTSTNSTTVTTVTTTATTVTTTKPTETAVPEQTEPETEAYTEPVIDEPEPETPSEETEQPVSDIPQPATEPTPAAPPPEDDPWGWGEPPQWGFPPFGWWNPDFVPPDYDHNSPWGDGNNNDKNDNKHKDDRRDGFSGTANTDFSGGIMLLSASDGEKSEDTPDSHIIKKKDMDFPKNERPGAEPVPRSLGTIDFFIVMADKNGKYLDSMNNDDLQEETAQNYIAEILNSGAETGTLNQLQFYQIKKDNGTLMVFTDKSAEIDMLNKLIRTTITIGVAAFLLLSVAAFFLSVQIVKPLKTAFEKQKQFVSDASHELKTPVTVISANADVLADEIGENKWLTYIKSQTERMNVLVNDLLNLTRLENNTADFITSDFDLSRAMINTALPFECQAFETNKKFIVDIDDDIVINGSEKHIKQMAAIFIDNALKYSNDGGTVRVTLKKTGDKKLLTVFNTGSGIKESEKDKIFERFYRSDESRNRSTGGYGLGLAIARSIIDKHKFKISVETKEGESICFIIIM